METISAGHLGDTIITGIVQMTPVWLNRKQTLEKMVHFADKAGEEKCTLVAFGEALLPGYPFWIELTNGARFDSPVQKEIHAHYMDQAVQLEAGQDSIGSQKTHAHV